MFNIIFGILFILLLIFDFYVIVVDDFQSGVLAKIATSLTFFVFFILSISLALKFIL